MKQYTTWATPLAVLAVLAIFFTLLFYADNKYETPPPYGKSGVITLNERSFNRNNPVFLIDGWLLTDGRVTDKPTYIGEFSNLQRGDRLASPHGRATYRLTLRYEGSARTAAVDFPQLSSWYAVSLDEKRLTQGTGNGHITFLLTPGDHVLTVETSSKLGYYSGMYFPPALSAPETLLKVSNLQSFFYALGLLLPLALAAFTLLLWRTGGSLSRWFGLLCCFYSLYMSRYFVFLFSLPAAPYWFFVQNLALYGMCFCVLMLTALAAGGEKSRAWKWMRLFMLLLPGVLLTLCLLIPVLPWAVFLHGRLTDLYYIVTCCGTGFFAVRGAMARNWEGRYTLAGCGVFAVGLILNLFFSNRFEPIRFFWQFEWCGLLLVVLFGAMMVERNRRVLRENEQLSKHLEQQVKKRTQEITQLLDERRAFFSDMAHDLKAPVFATQSFIEAIRRGGVGVDTELKDYLDLAEGKQREMARRLQGLSTINALDRIGDERERVSLGDLLAEVYAAHHGETEVQSVHLVIEPPEGDAAIFAQPEKLNILFENLIYNALRATPRGGSITISAITKDGKARITVADTGCGIPETELPLIFRRFYVGENNKATGTGLGLYIVWSIVTELGGTISAASVLREGTVFTIEIPVMGEE